MITVKRRPVYKSVGKEALQSSTFTAKKSRSSPLRTLDLSFSIGN